MVLFVCSSTFHSCKYHGRCDNENTFKIAYRGFEQFWHKYGTDYRLTVSDLIKYRSGTLDEFRDDMESRGFVAREEKEFNGNAGYYKWHYKSNDPILKQYEVCYGINNDTIVILYTIPDKKYLHQIENQFWDMGFGCKLDSNSEMDVRFYKNDSLGVMAMGGESFRSDAKPPQIILTKNTEFYAFLKQSKGN